MPYQQTSLLAYESVKPHIGFRQKQVLDCFNGSEILNDRQISERTGLSINCVTARRNELVSMNLLVEHGKRRDEKTNRLTIYWRLNN